MDAPLLALVYMVSSIRAYLSGSKKNFPAWLGGFSILENMSYRLPLEAKKDLFIGLKVFKRTAFALMKGFEPDNDSSSKILIFDVIRSNEKHRKDYVKSHTNQNVPFLSRESLYFFPGFVTGTILWMYLLFISAALIPLTFFSKKRTAIALLMAEFVELSNLIYLVKKRNVRRVHFFGSYEKDSNLISYALAENKVEIYKHPSPGPLFNHYSHLHTHQLCLTSGYQFEELPILETTQVITGIQKWHPENFLFYPKRYFNRDIQPPALTIGFYSHGSWLRKQRKDASDGLNIIFSEEQLLGMLASFLQKHPSFQLIVHCHPMEKKEPALKQTGKFYEEKLSGIHWKFQDFGIPTNQSFDKTDVGIGAYSTILYERLYCGFKTLVGCFGIKGFPAEGTSLKQISIINEEALEAKILQTSQLSQEDYLNQFGLLNYTWKKFPAIPLKEYLEP